MARLLCFLWLLLVNGLIAVGWLLWGTAYIVLQIVLFPVTLIYNLAYTLPYNDDFHSVVDAFLVPRLTTLWGEAAEMAKGWDKAEEGSKETLLRPVQGDAALDPGSIRAYLAGKDDAL